VTAAATPAPSPFAPPQAAPPAPAPQRLADNSAAAAPAASNAVPVRFYSLHREYGMTPDPAPTPTERPMVLIGPPDNPPAQPPSGDSVSGENQDGGGDAASGSDATQPDRHPGAQDSN
jgi:Meckel syndrome type 1 protein